MIFWRVHTDGYIKERAPASFKQINRIETKENSCYVHTPDTPSEKSISNCVCICTIKQEKIYPFEVKRIVNHRKTIAKIKIKDTHMQYIPGDSVTVKVSNEKRKTDWLMKYLGIDNNKYIHFRRIHIKSQKILFEYKGNIGDYFRHYLDISSLPSKYMLYKFSTFAADDLEKEYLLYLSSKEGSKDYFQLAKNWNDLCDIIKQFKVKIDLLSLLEVCTEIKPRAFSLIHQEEKEEIEFLCGIIEKTSNTENTKEEKEKSKRYGHFSSFAIRQIECSSISGFETDILYGIDYKPNRLMQMKDGGGILIGIGTGVSPFIPFLMRGEKRDFVLFYGCATEKESILHALNIIVDGKSKYQYPVHVIYSRQDAAIRMDEFFRRNTESINQLVQKHKKVYICGNKGAQKSLHHYFSSTYPDIKIYIDDWI